VTAAASAVTAAASATTVTAHVSSASAPLRSCGYVIVIHPAAELRVAPIMDSIRLRR
jgi:hypothetical protein